MATDLGDGPLVLGIGVGAFVLIIVYILSLGTCLLCARTKRSS